VVLSYKKAEGQIYLYLHLYRFGLMLLETRSSDFHAS